MPVYTILFGVALIAVGVGTYIGAGEGAQLSAFLLQMVLGLLAIGLGVGSIVKKPMRMHLMHAALIIAAMGVIVPVVMLVMFLVKLEQDKQMELLRVLGTVIFSGAYIYLAVQSFRAARRNRKDSTPQAPAPNPEPDDAAEPQ